jgi:hypothetical protein
MAEMQSQSQWASAALLIHSKNVEIGAISAALGCQPRYQSPVVEKKMSLSNIWEWHSGLTNGQPLAQHIEEVASFARNHASVLGQMRGTYTIEVWVGFGSPDGQGTFTIQSNVLEVLGSLGIPLILDLYPQSATSQSATSL